MDYYGALIVIPGLVAFAVSFWVAYKVYTGKSTEYRLAMSICFFFIAINSVVLMGEKLFPNLDIVLSLVVMEYISEFIILLTLLIFVLQYVGMDRLVTTRNIFLFGFPGLLTIVLNSTNQWHQLFYTSIDLVQSHGFYEFRADYGPFFLIWMAYFLIVIISTTLLMAKAMVESPRYRRKALWTLMVAMIIIMVTGVLYVLSSRSDPLVDILSIGLTLTALTIFIGERRSEFIDLEIVKFREAIIGMEDAVIILDSSLQIIFANTQGQKILDENLVFIKERLAARGLKIPIGSHKWETAFISHGSPRHFSITTSDIFRGDKPIGAVMVAHDITNRRMMEEEIRKANHGLSTLNQIVRHDIRNDLTSFWGYLELLQATPLNARQKELVDKMSNRARSADKHLTLTTDSQAPGSSSTVWQDPQDLIEKVLSQVDMGEVKVESKLQGILLMADPMLQNVFHCLADNTIRHGIKVTKVTVHAELTETGLSIYWEDDGVGIPIEHKGRIFERGFGQNTGEGLFLAHDILSMTDASISEEGEPGLGARFVIRVPSGMYTRVFPHEP